MAVCYFCFEDKRMTRAHLFHADIRKLFPLVNGSRVTSANSAAKGVSISRIGKYSLLDTNVSTLCADCNSKWMEPIERQAVSALQKRSRGERAEKEDLAAIAQWALIESALMAHVVRIDIPEEDRKAIRESRFIASDFGVFFIPVQDTLPSPDQDLHRGVSESPKLTLTAWVNVMHLLDTVIVVSSPIATLRVARILGSELAEPSVGFIGSDFISLEMRGANEHTHDSIHQLGKDFIARNNTYVKSPNGTDVVDFAALADPGDLVEWMQGLR